MPVEELLYRGDRMAKSPKLAAIAASSLMRLGSLRKEKKSRWLEQQKGVT